MREFFSTYFFPGPALALLGVYLAFVAYLNDTGLSQSSVELGLPSAALVVGVNAIAALLSVVGFCCTVGHRKR